MGSGILNILTNITVIIIYIKLINHIVLYITDGNIPFIELILSIIILSIISIAIIKKYFFTKNKTLIQ